jgi:hypothetical protein
MPVEAPAASHGVRTHGSSRVLRARAYVTTSYAAEVGDWPNQVERLVEDANRILEPTVDARLEVVEAKMWSTSLANDSLEPLLSELQTRDPGDDVDCVVGLVGSLPVLAHAFDHLGYGEVMGKHVAVRAMNDVREREVIDVELARLAQGDRERVYQTRKRHKAAAVFLHEVGHALGLVHEVSASSIMSTRYDKSMSSFSPASVELMRLTVEHGAAERKNDRAFLEQVLGRYEEGEANWVAPERESMIAGLKARLAGPPDASHDLAHPTRP